MKDRTPEQLKGQIRKPFDFKGKAGSFRRGNGTTPQTILFYLQMAAASFTSCSILSKSFS